MRARARRSGMRYGRRRIDGGGARAGGGSGQVPIAMAGSTGESWLSLAARSWPPIDFTR